MTRVEAPARLHFGLLSAPLAGQEKAKGRQFGGVGLMIDSPKVILHAIPAMQWAAVGPDAERAIAFAQRFMATLPSEQRRPFTIEVEACPEAHAGLGSGTALALAVARAIALETGHGHWPAVELAERVGRGERSAIGVHGFERGGLIVEAGKTPAERVAPLVGSHTFPSEWRIVLIRPPIDASWHGSRERQAFEGLTHGNPTESLCRLVLMGLLPALAANDVDAFGEALHEYNARAGEAFTLQQGGTYASPAVAELIGFLRKHGVYGVGQSSWGPTVFTVAGDEAAAEGIVEIVRRKKAVAVRDVIVSRAANGGARAL